MTVALPTMTRNRYFVDVALRPALGSVFQPTGFPDIGPARYQRPTGDRGWEDAVLVESAQSMANRLEATAWDAADSRPVSTFTGLPYVRVVAPDGEYLTSSRTEAHRLASAFVKNATLDGQDMKVVIRERLHLRDDRPLAPREIARQIFAMDPFCLLHGVFFAEKAAVWPGQPRIARVISATVEAHDVREVNSGGVKRDHVRHSLGDNEGGTAEGYGTVPFHRTDYTAARIVASFAVDLAQVRSYGLPDRATDLLGKIALWEMRSLLDGSLRLRSACDLVPISSVFSDTEGTVVPSLDQLDTEIRQLIRDCGDLVGSGEPIEVLWTSKKK